MNSCAYEVDSLQPRIDIIKRIREAWEDSRIWPAMTVQVVNEHQTVLAEFESGRTVYLADEYAAKTK